MSWTTSKLNWNRLTGSRMKWRITTTRLKGLGLNPWSVPSTRALLAGERGARRLLVLVLGEGMVE